MGQHLSALPWMDDIARHVLNFDQKGLPAALCLQADQGLGKSHQLRVLAGLLLCENRDQKSLLPCGECRQCRVMANQEHPDFLVVASTPKGSIGIDQIRNIQEFAVGTAFLARKRLVVIDELERMTISAANGLLKLLEEPPNNVHFLLSTAKASQLMPTVRSRLQFMAVQKPKELDAQRWISQALASMQIPPSSGALTDQDITALAFEIAQGAPLLALSFILAAKEVKSGVENIFGVKTEQPDLVSGYARLLACLDQSPAAMKTHLGIFVQSTDLMQASLIFELWLGRQMTHFKTNQSSAHQLEVLWSGQQKIMQLKQELARSPQLNQIHLKRRLLRAWLSCVSV